MRLTIIIFLTLSCCSIIAQFSESNDNGDLEYFWLLKGRYLPSPIGYTIGFGVERQISDELSVVCLYNMFRINAGSEESSNRIRLFSPEIRYHWNGYSNKSFFASAFVDVGHEEVNHSYTPDVESVIVDHHKKFVGYGLMVGKNLELSSRIYLDFYIGPRWSFLTEDITRMELQEVTTVNKDQHTSGLRIGMNLNFIF